MAPFDTTPPKSTSGITANPNPVLQQAMNNPQPVISEKPKKSGFGCFAIGCFSLIVIIIALGIGGYYVVKSKLGAIVESYTDTESMPLPPLSLSENQIDSVIARTENFLNSKQPGHAPVPLVLNGQEVNAFIAHSQNLSQFKDMAHIDIKDGAIDAQVSAPLDAFGLKGRVFNGKVKFTASLKNENVTLKVFSASVNKEEIPSQVLETFGGTFHVSELEGKNKEENGLKEFLESLESLEVKNNTLTIVPRKIR
jgi:hypothetical protein